MQFKCPESSQKYATVRTFDAVWQKDFERNFERTYGKLVLVIQLVLVLKVEELAVIVVANILAAITLRTN